MGTGDALTIVVSSRGISVPEGCSPSAGTKWI
jgi:hypothetical protein